MAIAVNGQIGAVVRTIRNRPGTRRWRASIDGALFASSAGVEVLEVRQDAATASGQVGLARLSRRRPTERYPALAPAPLGLEGVKDDRGGVHLLGARSLSPLVGCVERTTNAGGSLTVWGWAVDWRHAGRPPTVAVFAGGRCLERVEPSIDGRT